MLTGRDEAALDEVVARDRASAAAARILRTLDLRGEGAPRH